MSHHVLRINDMLGTVQEYPDGSAVTKDRYIVQSVIGDILTVKDVRTGDLEEWDLLETQHELDINRIRKIDYLDEGSEA